MIRTMPHLSYDCLKPVRVIGSDIYQFTPVRLLLTLILTLYSLLLLVQLYLFYKRPSLEYLIQCGPLFLQLSYAVLGFVVLVTKNHMVEDCLDVIELRDISSAGEDVKLRILRESRLINTFVVVNTALTVLWGTMHVCSLHDIDGVVAYRLFELLWPWQPDFCVLMVKMTSYLAVLATVVHSYQDSAHIVLNDVCQQQIEARLNVLIDRHCDFIRWKTNTLMLMSDLIVPFTFGAVVMGTSILLSFLQEVISWRSYLTATIGSLTVVSLITAGQVLQDESENMFLKFMTTKWYTWNIVNRKKLILILANAAQPIKAKFSDGFIINFNLLMFIFKTLFSVVSFLLSLSSIRRH